MFKTKINLLLIITTEIIVNQKNIPGHVAVSVMASTTVRTKINTSMKMLQTMRVVKFPLEIF